jgi:hypothetical protein
MRGEERRQRAMLMNLEERIAPGHPLRRVKQLAEAVLKYLSPTLDGMYSAVGRPSMPPERLLKGLAADAAVHGAQPSRRTYRVRR